MQSINSTNFGGMLGGGMQGASTPGSFQDFGPPASSGPFSGQGLWHPGFGQIRPPTFASTGNPIPFGMPQNNAYNFGSAVPTGAPLGISQTLGPPVTGNNPSLLPKSFRQNLPPTFFSERPIPRWSPGLGNWVMPGTMQPPRQAPQNYPAVSAPTWLQNAMQRYQQTLAQRNMSSTPSLLGP